MMIASWLRDGLLHECSISAQLLWSRTVLIRSVPIISGHIRIFSISSRPSATSLSFKRPWIFTRVKMKVFYQQLYPENVLIYEHMVIDHCCASLKALCQQADSKMTLVKTKHRLTQIYMQISVALPVGLDMEPNIQ